LIYGSVNAEDGDYIETSTIANGAVENGNVVETTSGSRYFLSPEGADNTATNIFNAFQSFTGATRRKGTITINKIQSDRKENGETMMNKLEQSQPRSTFSLFDLFGTGSGSPSKQQQSTAEVPSYPSPPPGKAPPEGIPILSSWEINDDGTITGFIFGSEKIGDGNKVTTSPIARGDREQYEMVTTVSGSIYYLN